MSTLADRVLRRKPARERRLSDRGVEMIAAFEGFVDHVYRDPVGIPTIGYGHVVRPGDGFTFATKITRERGLELLRRDAHHIAEAPVRNLVRVPLTQREYDALVSFTYNLGGGTLAASTLLRKLNAGDRRGAAQEFLRYVHADGRVLDGLVRRRRIEHNVFSRIRP